MATTNINIRTDSELKAKAQAVLSELGLDMSTAINVFLTQLLNLSKKPQNWVAGKEKSPYLMILMPQCRSLRNIWNEIPLGYACYFMVGD